MQQGTEMELAVCLLINKTHTVSSQLMSFNINTNMFLGILCRSDRNAVHCCYTLQWEK